MKRGDSKKWAMRAFWAAFALGGALLFGMVSDPPRERGSDWTAPTHD